MSYHRIQSVKKYDCNEQHPFDGMVKELLVINFLKLIKYIRDCQVSSSDIISA